MKYDVDKDLFAERLRKLMDDNNDTIYSLGEALGLNPSTISLYLNKHNKPRSTTITCLASHYMVDPMWLMGDEESTNPDLSLILPEKFGKPIPVYGYVAAGLPITAEENLIEYAYVHKRDKVDFGVIVKGDSMINARIFEGDVVFIEKCDVENGQIGVVQINGEQFTLKRIYRSRRTLELRSENPNYPPMMFSPSDKQVNIMGRVKKVQFEVK